MPRTVLIAVVALLLLVPATAQGKSNVKLRGTVYSKTPAAHIVSVKASRKLFSLRVPGSLSAIKAGQRVELRGSTLRARGRESRVLAKRVAIVTAKPIVATQSPRAADDDKQDDDNGATADDDDDETCTGSADDDDDHDSSGSGSADDDDDDHHSSGSGSADDDDDDSSGSCSVDDDDDSNVGPGSGDDEHEEDD
jgi:hypothetical protein